MSALAARSLLGRFFQREARRMETLTPKLSNPTSPSFHNLEWSPATNPFLRRREPDSHKFTRPLYSLRRQKMLQRALLQVQQHENISSGASTSAFPALPPSAPPSHREKSKPSPKVFKSTASNHKRTPTQLLSQAKKSGPYKGRRRKPFRGHRWEREAESVRLDRQEKIDQMPARIAEFVKVSKCPCSTPFLVINLWLIPVSVCAIIGKSCY